MQQCVSSLTQLEKESSYSILTFVISLFGRPGLSPSLPPLCTPLLVGVNSR